MSVAGWMLVVALMGQSAAEPAAPPSEGLLEYLGLWETEDEATVVGFALEAEEAAEEAQDPAEPGEEETDDPA